MASQAPTLRRQYLPARHEGLDLQRCSPPEALLPTGTAEAVRGNALTASLWRLVLQEDGQMPEAFRLLRGSSQH